jgi:lysophospholipase L1-like esterase
MNQPLTLAIIGDSAASGVGDSDAQGNYFGWGYHLAQAFTEPLIYINASRPGAQSKEVLQDQLPKVLIHEPDLVAVIVGGNDLLRNGFSPKVFEENLQTTLATIEKIGATSMLLELHDPTEIVPMPRLIARVCRRRVNAVNQSTRKLARRYGSILLETRSLEGIYQREKWHVDRMHPSKLGHQFMADNFAHLLRMRGYEIGEVKFTRSNNRSRKDSIIWMLKNGTPWFLKRSLDLLPALIFLSITELIHIARFGRESEAAEVFFPQFGAPDKSHNQVEKEWVS